MKASPNGTEALSLIEAKRPGLAVLDLQMPKLLWRLAAGVAISNLRFRGYTTTECWDHTR
jgi:CheY-like chemotaxis protein